MRSVTALLVHLLMLQFLVLGAGDACVRPVVAASLRAAVTHEGGVTPMISTRTNADVAGQGTACDQVLGAARHAASDHTQPHTPPGCQTLVSCAPAALPATTTLALASAPARVDAHRPPFAVSQPLARSTAPELPPPRA